MLTQPPADLQQALRLGLAMVSELWTYNAKNWVTSVHAADIDNDGDVEIIASSRDGRLHVLTRQGDPRWGRIIGNKVWIGAVTSIPFKSMETRARIIVGARNGRVYAYDKDGKTVRKDGKVYRFEVGEDGKVSYFDQDRVIDEAQEKAAFWYNTEQVIRQVHVNPKQPTDIVIGSEDNHAYSLDCSTGELHWKFLTQGAVRAVFSHDVDGDGNGETLVGSMDRYMYVLDERGHCIRSRFMNYPVHTIFAADIDHDGMTEILVGTDGKDLFALTADLKVKWHQHFENRLLSLYVADVDHDGHDEIIAGSEDKHIYILNAQGKTLWRHNLGYCVFSVYAFDIDRDGRVEVLAGSESMRVHALRFQLIKGLDKKIRKLYQRLGKPAPASLGLSISERALLLDILHEDTQQHVILKQITLQRGEELLAQQEYRLALSSLLRLERQKVQLLWRKEKIGHIRALCVGDVAGNRKQEIVVGTDEGAIQVFNALGRTLKILHLDDQIVGIQSGYIDRGEWEDIVVCSSKHHVYVINSMQMQERPLLHIESCITTMHVSAGSRYGPIEIIIGSNDKKLHIYSNTLAVPTKTIELPLAVKYVDASALQENEGPEIIVGSINHYIYAYARSGKLLWEYEAHDRIRAICMKDIDGNNNTEVIVGSEDRNIHVLDNKGQLKWRYYLPNGVLTIDAFDIDHDGKAEVFAGCADGYMYVFNNEGDLLWKYMANDRVRVVRVADIDDDGNVEIVLGSEDELELLQVVNQHHLRMLIDCCWSELQREKPVDLLIDELLHSPDPSLRAFGLEKLVGQLHFAEQGFEVLEGFVRDDSIEVRKSLIRSIISRYSAHPQKAQLLLNQLFMDDDQEVRLFFVEYILTLMKIDDQVGFEYLFHFFGNVDRFIRRAVIRKLYQLIDQLHEQHEEEILHLLLVAVQDKDSEWVCQEAGRALAHFLDTHQGPLLLSIYRIINRGVAPSIMRHIAHTAATHVVQQMFTVVAALVADLNESNMLERVTQTVKVLEGTKSLERGVDTWMMYNEFLQLLTIHTIDHIAYYQCKLPSNQSPDNAHYQTVCRICSRLNSITRILRIFLRRSHVDDRLTSLLEAVNAIDMMSKAIEREYLTLLHRELPMKLPDRHLFELLLKKWRGIVIAQLAELRGKAELKAELQTKCIRYEEQIGVWLSIHNTGRSTANNVKITLLYSSDFDLKSNNSFETEMILSQEDALAEFILQPHSRSLNLVFEIVYDDVEDVMKIQLFNEQLELQPPRQAFRPIPNPYSTGTPTHDKQMFFGREKDLAFLQDNLTRTSAKTVIVLYGQRRSGKTTLLIQLAHASLTEAIPVLVDMQHEAYQMSIQNFLHHLAFYIFHAMKKRGITVPPPGYEDFAYNPTFTFDLFLDDVEECLAERKLILLLDEFEVLEEQVKKGKLEAEIFVYLRSLMQHRQHINFLLSGTHKVEQLTKGYWSVFFNIACHYQLFRLDPKGAESLITKPVADFLEYEPHAVTKIRQLTADQPYLIHLVCRSLIDHCNEKRKAYITINDVNTVLHEVMQTGQLHFDWLWDQLSLEERTVLSVIAEGSKDEGRLLPLAEIEEMLRHYTTSYRRERVIASLKTLIDMDVIEGVSEDGQDRPLDVRRFRVPVGLIRRWLRQTKSLESVHKEENTV